MRPAAHGVFHNFFRATESDEVFADYVAYCRAVEVTRDLWSDGR